MIVCYTLGMHQRVRQALFWLFATIFVVTAPIVVLYTAGYRYNSTSGRLQRTGVIAVSTTPRGASITVNGELQTQRSPFVVQRLMPDTYTVELERKNYHSWKQDIVVGSGRTSYINATLFSDAQPELLLEEQFTSAAVSPDGRKVAMFVNNADVMAEVWLYDIASRTEHQLAELLMDDDRPTSIVWSSTGEAVILLSEDGPLAGWNESDGTVMETSSLEQAINPLPEYTFTDNGSNIELRKNDGGNMLVALLPFGQYSVIHRTENAALFSDGRSRAYMFTFATNAVSVIEMPVDILDWSEENNLFLASDEYEVDIVNPFTGERTLITRQSTPITDAVWYPNGQVILTATHDGIMAIDRLGSTSRVTTTLAEHIDATTIWVDQNGKNLYLLGSKDAISGIYRLKLN